MKLPNLFKKKEQPVDVNVKDNETQVPDVKVAKAQDTQTENLVTNERPPSEVLAKGMLEDVDLIAPSAIEVEFDYLKIGSRYVRTLFVSGYPRFVSANWLGPLINFDSSLDISMFYYPV